jgi:hypothetical protein
LNKATCLSPSKDTLEWPNRGLPKQEVAQQVRYGGRELLGLAASQLITRNHLG